MLQLFSTGLIPLWLNTAGILAPPTVPSLDMLDLLQMNSPDPAVVEVWQTYIARLSTQGFAATDQGFWLQTQRQLLANQNALQPLPAASLTKIATTLAALKTWGPDHTFTTEVRATGPITNGILRGDLVLVGGGDPLFVGPEAVSVGHSLNQMGIQQVSGNLILVGPFTIDFLSNPVQVGERLRQGLNGQTFQPQEESRYTPPPPAAALTSSLTITGSVQWTPYPPQSRQLLQHQSLPLYALLKQMNVNSNNALAEAFASGMGGAQALVTQVTTAVGVPEREVLLQNGSGLGQDNRLSPRAVTALLQGIQQELQAHQLTLADVFPVASRDLGTLEDRHLPTAAIVKTGTLWDVSALAGVIPTQKLGPVWFTIINRGENIAGFRQDQDRILQQVTQRWGAAPGRLPELQPSRPMPQLGNPERNQVISQQP
ncbi:D-alanyl-D-alanine carboxypeptidase [Acaryochloris sp. IP29b_bin.148]|uniref:D-alanyl-D-alanine carboxypeptidase n=1 Tax=Acaryochloris sp. IP29b_bin.148 TaxID=2969218 RepID=UPI0026070A16|nr:D-alanyl-D-alanine carboxypeptidase [Acaryochloris sp. IP29b_bin.148]